MGLVTCILARGPLYISSREGDFIVLAIFSSFVGERGVYYTPKGTAVLGSRLNVGPTHGELGVTLINESQGARDNREMTRGNKQTRPVVRNDKLTNLQIQNANVSGSARWAAQKPRPWTAI